MLKKLRTLLLKRFSVPMERPIKDALRSFTIAEKAIFLFFAGVFMLSGVILLWQVSSAFLVVVPTNGGTLTEGVIGNPRFINPVLAISEADKNLVSLVYSGLVRINPNGEVKNDLAEEVLISDDRTTYTVRIHPEARFHDHAQVTSDDIIFTIQKILDPAIKSPRRGNWEGISVNKIDDHTISFTLKHAYTPFIYNLATGILPKHIWKNVSNDEFAFSQFNTLPIGSGPYRVEKVERNSGGIPDFYQLSPFENGFERAPFIRNIVFRFYPNEGALIEAYYNNEIESFSGISPEKTLGLETERSQILSSPLPRVFAVFFNQNQSQVFLNKEVRQALELASPKETIIEEILGGYGIPINGPLPAGVYPWTSDRDTASTTLEKMLEAKELLADKGWQENPETGMLEKKSKSGTITLSFSISTGNAPELQQVASALIAAWGELGAKVNLLTFETGDLNQNVIRPRNFDALLFGEVVGRDADLYPFWHSSQRTDPGLNIALYANSRADKFLDDARGASDPETVEKNYLAFAEELKNDVPAVFLYTPSFLYVLPDKVKSVNFDSLAVSQDRFLGIRDWFVEIDKVWKVFID